MTAPDGDRDADVEVVNESGAVTHASWYTDPACYSCQRAIEDVDEYAFCGHIWDAAWKSEAATVVASDGRVWISGDDFEGRPDVARDLAATLIAAADAAEARWPQVSTFPR